MKKAMISRLLFLLCFFLAIIGFCFIGEFSSYESAPIPAKEISLPTRKEYLRIASLNCYNYLSSNRYTSDSKYKRHWPKPLAERQALCELVNLIQPDIIALQEIGGNEQVEEFQRDLRNLGIDFPHKAVLEGRDLSRRIAIISKIPFQKILKYAEPQVLTRGLLGADFCISNKSFTLFTLHLKSKYSRTDKDPNCQRERLQEARHIKKLIQKSGRKIYIILGDFNDNPDSPPLNEFSNNNFSYRLPARDCVGETWTYQNLKYGYSHTLDHILLSPKAMTALNPQDAKIADAKISKRAGDHRMIYVDLELSCAE